MHGGTFVRFAYTSPIGASQECRSHFSAFARSKSRVRRPWLVCHPLLYLSGDTVAFSNPPNI